jgi:hypothetical protein
MLTFYRKNGKFKRAGRVNLGDAFFPKYSRDEILTIILRDQKVMSPKEMEEGEYYIITDVLLDRKETFRGFVSYLYKPKKVKKRWREMYG